jgi:Toastrack DUF4097
MRLTFRALILAACAPAALAAQDIVGRNDRVFTVSPQVAAGDWVRIYSRSGDIGITEGTGGTVQYRAEKDVRGGDVSDIAFRVIRGSGGVTICAVFYDDDDSCDEEGMNNGRNWRSRNSRERARVNITVSLPRGVRLRANTGNGTLTLNAAVAEATVGSGNGRVRVGGVTGRVQASSGNGEVSVDNVGGPVRASSGNGDVSVTAVNGPINASSGNGDIIVAMDRLSGDDDLEFSSGNGRIEVTVPADFSAEVEATSGNGHVVTDFPITVHGRITPSRLRGTIGKGGRRLHMSTGNGSMEIRKRG